MSKSSEEAAQKAIPNHPSDVIEKLNIQRRRFFSLGYEQAEKDTIERAWEWMTSAKGENTFEDFRKAMEEEWIKRQK